MWMKILLADFVHALTYRWFSVINAKVVESKAGM